MSTTEHRPFTAATNKFAYAQAFSRDSIRHEGESGRTERRRAGMFHLGERRSARRLAAR